MLFKRQYKNLLFNALISQHYLSQTKTLQFHDREKYINPSKEALLMYTQTRAFAYNFEYATKLQTQATDLISDKFSSQLGQFAISKQYC